MNALKIAVERLNMRFPGKTISDKLEFSKGVISEFLNGKRELSENFKELFKLHYGIDLNEIEKELRLKNEKTTNFIEDVEYFENKNGNKFTQLPNGQYIMTMPIVEVTAQAGLLDNYQNAEYLMDMEQYGLVTDKPAKGRYIAFRVSGHSMDDGMFNSIPDKSIVCTRELQRIHWKNKLHINDFPYWVIYTSQSKMPLLKEIIEHNTEEGYIICHSLNDSPEYADFKLYLDDIQSLFYVIEVKKSVSKKINYT